VRSYFWRSGRDSWTGQSSARPPRPLLREQRSAAVYVGRDVHPDVAVDKLIRACSVDPPVKYTVSPHIAEVARAMMDATLVGERLCCGRGQ
jgi:hypothetical protein